MNIDYKEKYLKYKSKYLLAKSLKGGVLTQEQQAIVKKITEGFVSEKKLDTHNIQHYMHVIGKNATLLTKQKIELLFDWSVLDEKTAPVGFGFVTSFDEQIESIKKQMNKEHIKEEDYEYYEIALNDAQKNQKNLILDKKNSLYDKLLSKIFDDSITIELFTQLANQRIE